MPLLLTFPCTAKATGPLPTLAAVCPKGKLNTLPTKPHPLHQVTEEEMRLITAERLNNSHRHLEANITGLLSLTLLPAEILFHMVLATERSPSINKEKRKS
jgi:hypothetical protein